MNNNVMKLIDNDGIETEYEIICAYKLESTKKFYIVYTDNKFGEDGNLNIYASIYYPNDNTRLDPIETDYEWDEVTKRVNALKKDN